MLNLTSVYEKLSAEDLSVIRQKWLEKRYKLPTTAIIPFLPAVDVLITLETPRKKPVNFRKHTHRLRKRLKRAYLKEFIRGPHCNCHFCTRPLRDGGFVVPHQFTQEIRRLLRKKKAYKQLQQVTINIKNLTAEVEKANIKQEIFAKVFEQLRAQRSI